jgi:hypothetical protein
MPRELLTCCVCELEMHKTRGQHELEYFFPEFNIRLYDKNSESEYFFQQHWESEYFFRKKPYPPFKLNGRYLS